MKTTKKITVSAMVVALGAIFLVVGSYISAVDLIFEVVASLLAVFVYIELGSPYTWLVWPATTLTVAFLPNGISVAGLYFLVFGIYPILKAYIERLPKVLWWPVKLAYINAVIWLLIYFVDLIFGTPFLEGDTVWLQAAMYLLINVAFVMYDVFITVMVRFYFDKLRHRFSRFLR
jgi:hypothetical protein